MKLDQLSQSVSGFQIIGQKDVEIRKISTDSKNIQKGDLFFPIKGQKYDGLSFLQEAIDNGAQAVVVPEKQSVAIPQLVIPRSVENLKKLCLHLYDRPTEKLNVIGVTGTNGKTSICHFIEGIFKRAKKNTAYIGTTEYRWLNQKIDAKLTTPMFENLQYYFYQMAKDQIDTLVMECSSHGIELGRIDAIEFNACVFTNLTHEHLDFHETMEGYENAKRRLFSHHLHASMKKGKFAVINRSDEVGAKWIQEKVFSNIISYGLESGADIYPLSIESKENGMQVQLSVFGKKLKFYMPTLGTYNVSNMMAAIAVCKTNAIQDDIIVSAIESGIDVPGRLQKINIDAPFTVIVDYAYTEDALKNVLQTLLPFKQNRIITVFGCGGDRDATRRPKMAKAVYAYSDQIIVTTDNPRTEDPSAIIEEVIQGISDQPDYDSRVSIEVDRKKAIAKSLQIARQGDIVLIAGKGHETYQEIFGIRYPFDDRELVKEFWKNK